MFKCSKCFFKIFKQSLYQWKMLFEHLNIEQLPKAIYLYVRFRVHI